jgi:hypothetical protein
MIRSITNSPGDLPIGNNWEPEFKAFARGGIYLQRIILNRGYQNPGWCLPCTSKEIPMRPITLLFLLFLLTTSLSFGQAKCACCTAPYQQFDFWVGNWNVYDTAGNKVGENEVAKLEDGCLITEHWQGAQGDTGRSSNYYNPSDSTWNQLWVSNTGTVLLLKGHGSANRMTMTGPVHDGAADRITWTKNGDGSVTQQWDRVDAGGKTVSVLFNGRYAKK